MLRWFVINGLLLDIWVVYFNAHFSSGEGPRNSIPRRTQNTWRNTAIPDSSACSSPSKASVILT